MRKFLACTRGATAAEYALLLAVLGTAVGGASLVLAREMRGSMVTTAGIIHEAGETPG